MTTIDPTPVATQQAVAMMEAMEALTAAQDAVERLAQQLAPRAPETSGGIDLGVDALRARIAGSPRVRNDELRNVRLDLPADVLADLEALCRVAVLDRQQLLTQVVRDVLTASAGLLAGEGQP